MLELQQDIEEKRLILGKKFENFLLKNLRKVGAFLRQNLSAKSGAFFGTLVVALISIFIRSTRDIGYNSGFFLDLTSINQILLADFLVNLIGILSIYLSFLILKKSEIAKNKFALNLLIISFSVGFFLRSFTLQFNDFITFYSAILAISFPIIAFCFRDLSRDFRLKNKKVFCLFASLVALFLVFYSGSDFYGNRSLVYSLLLPAIVMLAYRLNSKKCINWKRDFIILIFILAAPQFDPRIFDKIVFNLGAFWWVIVLFFVGSFRLNSVLKKPIFSFLMPRDFFSWLYFVVVAAFTIFLLSKKNTQEFAWFFSTVILIILTIFYQKIHEKTANKRELSTFSASAIFLVFSYIINLHLAAIFNFYYASKYKSPNQVSEQIAAISKSYKKGEISIISDEKSDIYPIANYIEKINSSSFLAIQNLYKNSTNHQDSLDILQQKIGDKKNKIIILKQGREGKNQCQTSFLEYYFYDREFKKTFLQNYVFLTKITEKEEQEKPVKFFLEGEEYVLQDLGSVITREFEVYVRK